MCFGGSKKIEVQPAPIVEPSPPVEFGKVSEELEAEKNPQEYKKKFGKRKFVIELGGTNPNTNSSLKV
jgi:hypothetical protein